MRRRLAGGLAVAVLATVLTGCSNSSPQADLQSRSNDVVSSANAGDAAALRGAANRMLAEIQTQLGAGDITTAKAHALQVLLSRILANAEDLEPVESPSPSPSSEPSPSPSPSPEPSPSESPSPPPSPEPSPSEESPSPEVVPSVLSPEPLAPQAGNPSPAPS